MTKQIIRALTVALLLHASAGYAMDKFQTATLAVIYGGTNLIGTGVNTVGATVRKVPGGNLVADHALCALLGYAAIEYAYTKYYGEHTKFYNYVTDNKVTNSAPVKYVTNSRLVNFIVGTIKYLEKWVSHHVTIPSVITTLENDLVAIENKIPANFSDDFNTITTLLANHKNIIENYEQRLKTLEQKAGITV